MGLFWCKKLILCHVQPYISAFRNRKDGKKIFAAQTPPRKRGYTSIHLTIVGKTSKHLRSLPSSLADAPHCSIMGFVQTQTISEKVLFFIFSDSQQDSLFCPARCREMTLLNYSFMFGWCEVKIRFCFVGTKWNFYFILLLQNNSTFQSYLQHTVSIVYSRTCSDLSQPPAFWWLTAQAGGREYPIAFSKLRAAVFFAAFFLKRKRVLFRTP